MVIKEVKAKKLSSIDEVIHDLILNRHNEIDGLITVCTKTFYNYVHQEKIKLIPLDLPRMCSRRIRLKKTYISKAQKGTSITERPFAPKDRSEFGHWEGDLIVGGREGGRGALLTLLERKTSMYYMIPISDKTAKQVYMKVNRLEKQFGLTFPKVFKTITFDNGSEFARHKDIEKNQLQKKNVLVFILVGHIDHVIVLAMRIVMDLFAILSLKDMQLIPFQIERFKITTIKSMTKNAKY